METRLRSFPHSAADSSVRLTDEKLDLQSLIQRVQGSGHGAVVTFSGCVRDMENGQIIQSITYEAYSGMAFQELKKIVVEAKTQWLVRVALEHRTGNVPVGEASVMIACAGAHHREALDGCQYVIDELKARVPIWKVRFE